MKIFNREPALYLNSLAGVLGLAVTFNIGGLDAEEAGWIVAGCSALLGAVAAALPRPIAVHAFTPAVATIATAVAEVPLHDRKRDLRDLHRLLVGSVARAAGIDHRRLNAELISRTGSRVDQATLEQLEKRIELLQRWRDRGYDGKH